ncbi:aspartate carbamoyltransferase regulatory subunit [Sulfodiicoccus acidiphilus]|uniref:Aspartate carbamoyltransferase regulatory chain n=1 Tax=Sulfodiicoccus acidiphilus TaxID=1670455 RepID=A0A348B1B2_9CREN|nr:aspartate carbamoyltransferase regulatory subunit [Sulfodiicoccus acidiphilus]BBD71964.1 aspartate carbamoyltransferase regulatory subunit [Sulfodiicoccus acidiphilus]GGT91805.1 aspartate carbamoyltransferase regulatory subunit [Sulfodiicoccus acidiphilus]
MEGELIVRKIREGTVIDHIPRGKALLLLRLMGIKGDEGYRLAVVSNVESKKMGKKDIIKVEGKELKGEEVDLIALVAPTVTINIVRNFEVVEKRKISVPKIVRGLLKCPNTSCVSNNDPEAVSEFSVRRESPLLISCSYCESRLSGEDVVKQLSGD